MPTRRRVYELAKDYGMRGPDMAVLLRKLGFDKIKSHMAVLDDVDLLIITARLDAQGLTRRMEASAEEGDAPVAKRPSPPEKQPLKKILPSNPAKKRLPHKPSDQRQVTAPRAAAAASSPKPKTPRSSPQVPTARDLTAQEKSQQKRRDQSIRRQVDALAAVVNGCLTSGTPPNVNLQIPRHGVLVPVLRDAVYNTNYSGKQLPITFTDGSRPKPFPVGVLRFPTSTPTTPEKAALLQRHADVLKLGLMSMRHPDMDYFLDLYIVRNSEVARDEHTSADREQLAFRRASELLSDPSFDAGGQLWVYQTGLEFMSVGFYRAVAEVLSERQRRGKPPLVIQPWFLDPILAKGSKAPDQVEHEVDGQKLARPRYTKDAPGADLANYSPSLPWA